MLQLEKTFDKFKEKEKINKIFFEGELYDAYSILLDTLKKIYKKIIIVSKNIDEVLKKKYESQYNNITFLNNNSFHDRFIIIDKDKLYSCGASFKDLDKKCFAINEFNNNEYLIRLLSILDI